MADVKISGLPASTVPLAGTEVLPIVQGGATKQVSIANVTAGRVVAASGVTTDTYKAASSAGGTLQANNATACLQWGAGGGSGLIFDGGVSSTAANAALVFSPTGTGTVAISPAGALTINPTAASTINNTSIGVTTPAAGGFTTVKAATTIGVGAATPAASGAGITFPATQAPSTDVNTLDDYEEGDWTTTVASTSNVTGTPTLANGRYIKIGKQIFIQGRFSVNVTTPATDVTFTFTHPFVKNTTDWSTGLIVNDSTYALGAVNNSGASASTWYFLLKSVAVTSGTANYQFSITYIEA
jgi:hypothetical protein